MLYASATLLNILDNIQTNNKDKLLFIDIDNNVVEIFTKELYQDNQTFALGISSLIENIISFVRNLVEKDYKVILVTSHSENYKELCPNYIKKKPRSNINATPVIKQFLESKLNEEITNDTIIKATRKWLYNLLSMMVNRGIKNASFIQSIGIETDYVIAYLVLHKFNEYEKIIISTDKDYLQLLRSDNIYQIRKSRKTELHMNAIKINKVYNKIITRKNLKFDYNLDHYFDIPLYLALSGDSSDGVKSLIRYFKLSKKDFFENYVAKLKDRKHAKTIYDYLNIVLADNYKYIMDDSAFQCNMNIVSFDIAVDKLILSKKSVIDKIDNILNQIDDDSLNNDLSSIVYEQLGIYVNV